MSIIQKQIVGKKESITDEILLLNAHQTPFINVKGFSESTTQVEHVWFEDEMYADETTVATALTNVATTLAVADGSIFEAKHVIKVGDELLLVTAKNVNDLTVTRGYAGTTAAAASVGAKVEFQFAEGVEGSDARASRFKARARKSNLTQIFDETIKISGTAAATSQHGIDNLYEYEKQKKQLELALQLEKAVINGVKYESGDGLVRQMGGLRNFIVTNVSNVAGALTEVVLNDMAQKVYEAGGLATGGDYKFVVGAKQKRAISALGANSVRLTRGENTRGQVVDFFVTDFGEFEIVLNNNVAADELFLVDLNRIDIRPLQTREFAHEFMGRKGDYYVGSIVGEYTIEIQQEKAHARAKGLS